MATTFSGTLSDSAKIFFLRTSAPIGELEFDEVAGNGSIMFDVFVSEDSDIHYSKRMVINGNFKDSNFYLKDLSCCENECTC